MNISSFQAIRYRGISGLSLSSLSRANLITGVNGVGKTALIEAIWLFAGRHNLGFLWDAGVQRSSHTMLDPVAELADIFIELRGQENGKNGNWKVEFEPIEQFEGMPLGVSDFDGSLQISIVGRLHGCIDDAPLPNAPFTARKTPWGEVTYGVPLNQAKKGACIIEGTNWHFATSDEYLQRYSDMVRDGHKPALTEAINLILPGIKDIELLTDKAGKSYLSANTSTGARLPLQALGGGVVRLFRLYLNFFTARNGMVLVDEVENGLHYSVLQDLWRLVRRTMDEWNVQFVATTHSSECIEAAMAAFESEPSDLSIHKLYADESGNVRATTFTGETLEGARDLNLEVR